MPGTEGMGEFGCFTSCIQGIRRVYTREYEYSLRASICIPYGYVDLKYMIYAIYMIDLGH